MSFNNQFNGGYAAGGASNGSNGAQLNASQGYSFNRGPSSAHSSQPQYSAQNQDLSGASFTPYPSIYQYYAPAQYQHSSSNQPTANTPPQQSSSTAAQTSCPGGNVYCGTKQTSGMHVYCFNCISATPGPPGYSSRNRPARTHHRD